MYELTLYQNGAEKLEMTANLMTLSPDSLSFNNSLSTNVVFNDGKKGIDIFDVKFSSKVKTADKQDYLFAILCGSVSAAFDQFAIGRTNLSKLKQLDKKELFNMSKNILLLCGYTSDSILNLQTKYEQALNTAEEKINNAPKYRDLAKDFRDSLSTKGLFFALFAAITGVVIGEDEKGKLNISRDANHDALAGKTVFQKIELGFIEWIIGRAFEYRQTGKFKDEIDDLVNGKDSLKRLKDMIRSLADTKLFRDKTIDKTDVYKILSNKVLKDTEDLSLEAEKMELLKQLTRQSVPVLLNKCLVRTYLFVKLLINELNERNVKSLEGLSLVSISVNSKTNQRVLARLDTVSTGVFLALDGAEALYYASKEAIKAGGLAAAATPGEEKIRSAAAIKEGIKAGIFAYASSFNMVNAFEFVAVVKADSQYLIEDVKAIVDKEVVAKQKALEKAREENQKLIINTTKLNKVETKILYSLKLDLVENDINNTKDSETAVKKQEWKKAWMELSEKATEVSKLFYEDQDKVYAQLKTHAANDGDKGWIYRIVLELMRFTPYTPIDEKEPKKYSKLKPSKVSYMDSVFCEKQNIVSMNEVKEMEKVFKKHYDHIGGSAEKTAKGAVGAVAVAAATGIAAFTFAPAIAVALAGNAFAGLSGAALTSASLAFFGGGAIAAGGLGMAGGTMVIAGGGALLGLGASGATLASLMMMSSSALVQEDYAKLLTNCDYNLLDKYFKLNEVIAIQEQVRNSLNDYKIQLELIRNSNSFENKKEQKLLLKEMEKSFDVVERAKNVLEKLVYKAERKKEN